MQGYRALGTIVLVQLWTHEVHLIAPRDQLSPLSTMSGVTTRANLCGWNEEYRCRAIVEWLRIIVIGIKLLYFLRKRSDSHVI